MDSSPEGSSFSPGGEHSSLGSPSARRLYRRHSSYQIARLEESFKVCSHPNETMRLQLSTELGLEPNQVKFWFQNKRTQAKNQTERIDNTTLRQENERMLAENLIIREALKSIICLTCGGPTLSDDAAENIRLQNLKLENLYLKQKYERLSQFVESFGLMNGSMLPQNVPLSSPTQPLLNSQIEIPSLYQRFLDQCEQHMTVNPAQQNNNSSSRILVYDQDNFPPQPAPMDHQLQNHNVPYRVHDFASLFGTSNDGPVMHALNDGERGKMEEAATNAMEELTRLLRMNEPFWFRSTVDGSFILQRESYDRIFYKVNHLNGPRARRESSKDSRLVIMSGPALVEMFLDPEKWASVFTTMVKRAETIEVLNNGLPEGRSGALQLMNAEMHILSPFVPCREFCFLRYCMQVDAGAWVIADVSFNSSKFDTTTPPAWRLPSGCLIHDMNDGSSRVTWVEHVEVDDWARTHRIFRELVCEGNAFGAERWGLTLERMCERFAFASMEQMPISDAAGVISLPEGRRNVMQLAERMVKQFCGALVMSDHMEFPFLRGNNCGVRISVRHTRSATGVPRGVVVHAATTFWLPLHPNTVFDYLKNPATRPQWDVLCHGQPVELLQHISNGSHPDNFTSIIKPFVPRENDLLVLQECCVDSLGCMLVYAPVDFSTITVAISGGDTSTLPILASGFTIAGDSGQRDPCTCVGNSHASASKCRRVHHGGILGGSLITVVFQVLASCPSSLEQLKLDSVASVNTLVSSTVEDIKAALNCSHLE